MVALVHEGAGMRAHSGRQPHTIAPGDRMKLSTGRVAHIVGAVCELRGGELRATFACGLGDRQSRLFLPERNSPVCERCLSRLQGAK